MRCLIMVSSLTLMVTGTAHGEMSMTLTGTPASSIVEFFVSGSDAATRSFSAPVIGAFLLTIVDGFDPFPSGVNGGNYGEFPLVSGGGTVSNSTDADTKAITAIVLQDSVPAGERFGVAYSGFFRYDAGDVFEWQGSGTFDLSTKGLCFGDLVQGSGDATVFLDGIPMGIDGQINITSVPEPSGLALLAITAGTLLGYGLRRGKKGRQERGHH